jgi:hypothetical protein
VRVRTQDEPLGQRHVTVKVERVDPGGIEATRRDRFSSEERLADFEARR